MISPIDLCELSLSPKALSPGRKPPGLSRLCGRWTSPQLTHPKCFNVITLQPTRGHNMTQMSELVHVARRFQRSIKIDADLQSPDALTGFVCPESSAAV